MRAQLARTLNERSIERRRCILACGKQSDFVVDCMPTILVPSAAQTCGFLMWQALDSFDPCEAVAGVELGGCPLASALVAANDWHGWDPTLVAMYVRKTGAVEGLRSVPPALRVVVVDDVLATGGSLLRAVAALRSAGAFVVGSVVLVDREIGGRQAVESDGVPLVSIFTLTELTQSG